jgi:hypothetical protein
MWLFLRLILGRNHDMSVGGSALAHAV